MLIYICNVFDYRFVNHLCCSLYCLSEISCSANALVFMFVFCFFNCYVIIVCYCSVFVLRYVSFCRSLAIIAKTLFFFIVLCDKIPIIVSFSFVATAARTYYILLFILLFYSSAINCILTTAWPTYGLYQNIIYMSGARNYYYYWNR